MSTPNGSSPHGSTHGNERTESAISAGMASGDTDAVMRAVANSDIVVPQANVPPGEEAPEGSLSLPVIEQDGTSYVPVFTSEETMHAAGQFAVADAQPGAVTMKIREALLGIQHGTAPDPHGWMHQVV